MNLGRMFATIIYVYRQSGNWCCLKAVMEIAHCRRMIGQFPLSDVVCTCDAVMFVRRSILPCARCTYGVSFPYLSWENPHCFSKRNVVMKEICSTLEFLSSH